MLRQPLPGVSAAAKEIDKGLEGIRRRYDPQSTPQVRVSVEEQLYDALAQFKTHTAQIAMHLDRGWRDKLFAQLDGLLSMEDWEPDDLPPTLMSFATFLRMLIAIRPDRRPGLGASHDGRLIAAWTVGTERLTIECLPNDLVRWVLSRTLDGDRERAAGEVPLSRLMTVLAPYQPDVWFRNADHVPQA